MLAISISLVVFAFVVGTLALIWLRRRHKKRVNSADNEVYPEAAYLYDPPMNAKASGHPPALPPVVEIGDAGGAGQRSTTPEIQTAERQALLGEPAPVFAGGAVAGGLRGYRRGYRPAPIEEMNENGQEPGLGDHGNPFADQHSTEYDSGRYAVAQDTISVRRSAG